MAFDAITEAEIVAGKPVTHSMMSKIKGNLDDLDSRVASLGGNFIIWNELMNYNSLPQGTMLWSFESEGNFQALFGTEWKVVDSTTGTFTDEDGNAISVPDVTDRFLMNKGDGLNAVKGLLGSKTKLPDNSFTTNTTGAHSHTITTVESGIGVASGLLESTGDASSVSTSSTGDHSHTVTGGGDSVTRPETVVANLFIKTAEIISTKRLIFRASSAMTLNTFKVTQLISGTSGTLELDIKKGSSLGALTTMLSTNPSVVYTAGNYATSSNVVFDSTAIATNDWLVIDTISLQNTRSQYHIQVEANATT